MRAYNYYTLILHFFALVYWLLFDNQSHTVTGSRFFITL